MIPGRSPKTASRLPDPEAGAAVSTSINGLARLNGRSGPLLKFEPQRDRYVSDLDEIFRGIYTRTYVSGTETIAICSAIAGEGRTTVGLGLGVRLAQDFPERQVLVVETDMQRPALADDFQIEAAPGLLDCLENGEPVHAAYRDTYLPNFQIVPVGGPVNNPSRLLRSSRMASTIDMMRETHDLVILDLPPLLLNSDSILLADLADGIVMVVRAGATSNALVTRALDEIDQSKLRGIVLNGTQSAIPGWLRRLCGI